MVNSSGPVWLTAVDGSDSFVDGISLLWGDE